MKPFLLFLALCLFLLTACVQAGTIVQLKEDATGCTTYISKEDMWLECRKVRAQKAVVADNPEYGHELGGRVRLELVGGKALWFSQEEFVVESPDPSK